MAEFYRTALAYIIEINARGIPFREEYSSLILRKMLLVPDWIHRLAVAGGDRIAGLF